MTGEKEYREGGLRRRTEEEDGGRRRIGEGGEGSI